MNSHPMDSLEGTPRTPLQAIVDSGMPDSVPYVLPEERENDSCFHGGLIARFRQASSDIQG